MSIVGGKVEMTVMPAVNAVLLHNSVLDTGTEGYVVSTLFWENGGSACSFCGSVTSQCLGYRD